MLKRTLWCLIAGIAISGCATATSLSAERLDGEGVDRFIAGMVGRHGFDAAQLRAVFADARRQAAILDAISRPAEAKPWYQYRPIFITPDRIDAGVAFWRDHAAVLERARQTYGVEPEIVVAIIGVETFYGRNTGKYRVIDALGTLAFHYPQRAEFFRGELEQYLLLTRDQRLDPRRLNGSYAGAMGLPQFIPSSYRHYAVDFDRDGRTDIWDGVPDAIGSVARYLKEHGWRAGETVAVPARVDGGAPRLAAAQLKAAVEYGRLAQSGVRAESPLGHDVKVGLLEFDNQDGREYWLGLNNFYAITRYNRSPLYAMAVYQLATLIREGYGRAGVGQSR